MHRLLAITLLGASAAAPVAAGGDAARGDRLAKPVLLEADGKPLAIDRAVFLYPFVGDLDGDGRQALLLGTYDGRLLVYRNAGSKTSPGLGAPRWFDDEVSGARVPVG
jgi:hypothetical protein